MLKNLTTEPHAHQAETLRKLFLPMIILCHSCYYCCSHITQEGNKAKRNLAICLSLHHWWMQVWVGVQADSPVSQPFATKSPCRVCALEVESSIKEQSLAELMSRAVYPHPASVLGAKGKDSSPGRLQRDRSCLVPPDSFTALGSNPTHVYKMPGSWVFRIFTSRICY